MSQDILPVIHIGMPKTATKTLQWRLFAGHDEIFYLGRYDGSIFQGQYREYDACRDATVLKVMDQIAYRNIHNPDMDSCKKIMSEYLKEPLSKGLTPVWSWESYCTDSSANRKARAENLKALFGRARIVVGIRHPVKLLTSAYMQQLKRDNIGGHYSRARGSFYQDIDDWVMRDHFGDISNHLEYPETIRMYAEAFGEENVCVAPFELLVADSQSFYQLICDFIGVDSDKALQLLGENVDNSRWTGEQLERLKEINGSWYQNWKFRWAKKRDRKAMLGLDRKGKPIVAGPGASPRMSENVRQHVIDKTRAGNQWLEQHFQLGLNDYGYFEP